MSQKEQNENPGEAWNEKLRSWEAENDLLSMDEEGLMEESDREEWYIAPAQPSKAGAREWRLSKKEACLAAEEFAERYNCIYEVYKRMRVFGRPNKKAQGFASIRKVSF